MSTREFHFQLKKIRKEDQVILEKLHSFFPSGESVDRALQNVFQRHLNEPVTYSLERVEVGVAKNFYVHLPYPCIVALFGLPSVGQKAFLQMDAALVYRMVDRLLGGEGKEMQEVRPLTDTEQGVLEYFLLQLLKKTHQALEKPKKAHFRLDQTILHPQNLERFIEPKERMVFLTFRIGFQKQNGFLHTCIPYAMLQEVAISAAAGKEDIKKRLKQWGSISADVWGELGFSEVSMKDLDHLEAGDVFLFDQTGLTVSSGHWSGDVVLRAGHGEHGGLRARWSGFHKGGKVEVKGG